MNLAAIMSALGAIEEQKNPGKPGFLAIECRADDETGRADRCHRGGHKQSPGRPAHITPTMPFTTASMLRPLIAATQMRPESTP